MRILLFGKNGQVGSRLCRTLSPLGDVVALGRKDVDFCRQDGLIRAVNDARADIIVNAAAYTNVDEAERDPHTAHAVNADAPALLAREAARTGALFVHFSTDYVFDGSGHTPWTERGKPAPINAYGRSKLAADMAIEGSGCRHLILRSGWIYAADGAHNFIRSILSLAQQKDTLDIVCDQFGSPTDAGFLADAAAKMIADCRAAPEKCGLYHVAAAGYVSRLDYAAFILKAAGLKTPLRGIKTADFPTAAQRPLNCRMGCSKFQDIFGIAPPDWRESTAHAAQQIQNTLSLQGEGRVREKQ
jgi:dTDP-4-dehydrorhamnose reductase